MKKIISFALILLFCPSLGLTTDYRSPARYWGGPYGHHYNYPPPPYSGGRHGYYPYSSYHHHDNWIVPLAIIGTALGIMALSQPYYPPPPPPRMCRDTYNYVDQYGRYLYSEYVDRPCRY